jgi:thiopeptide-type bacteriocin biosynthesis protein
MQSKFILGDEWIYYKLYCGKKTADTILVEIIKPLVEKLLKENTIDKWFFIRYNDPHNHLRIRFHCNDISKIGLVIDAFNKAITYNVNNDFIWKLETATYLRELKRYGKNTITESERLFFYDSIACINALILIEDDELLFLFVLKSIDAFLTIFEYDLKAKISFAKQNSNYFKKEFNADKYLSKQLNVKYQKLRKKVESFMALRESEDYDSLLEILSIKNKNIEPIKNHILQLHRNNTLKVSLDSLLSSYIHMTVNRQFRDKQRLFELLCYDFLFRYYNSIFAKRLK